MSGELTVLRRGGAQGPDFRADTDGRGCVELYAVLPGLTAAFGAFEAGWASFSHAAQPEVLALDYCCEGRIGWEMRSGATVYLGPGDLALHSLACCADSRLRFPLGRARQTSFRADLRRLAAAPPPALQAAGLDAWARLSRFCTGLPGTLPACPELEAIFSPLLRAPESLRPAYLLLKAQELLLYLAAREADAPRLTPVHARQTEQVRAAHDYLVTHLQQRCTIEALSHRFLLNTATLKTAFKAVYGLPIATYMKECRVREAMRLLRETDERVSDIAAAVGYESQGKFTKAFKDVAQILPTEYRRQQRGNA